MADWITTKEAGKILGVNIRTIQRYVAKGKLKAKMVSGNNAVKKDAVLKLRPTAEAIDTTPIETPLPQSETSKPNWQIPDGYMLIDKSTLDSLRDQINKLTDSVGEMQLTQKLLIEKGLNLNDNSERILPTNIEAEKEIITTPVETVAKAHEEFFGAKTKKNNWNMLWLVLGAIAGTFLLLLLVNYLANQSL